MIYVLVSDIVWLKIVIPSTKYLSMMDGLRRYLWRGKKKHHLKYKSRRKCQPNSYSLCIVYLYSQQEQQREMCKNQTYSNDMTLSGQ